MLPRVARTSVSARKVRHLGVHYDETSDLTEHGRLALEFDLELESTWLFDEFFAEFSKRHDNAQLLHRMHALNSQGTISPDEWEAASTYLSTARFALRGPLQLCTVW